MYIEHYFTADIRVIYTKKRPKLLYVHTAERGYIKCIKRIDNKLYGFVVFNYNNDVDNWRNYTAARCEIKDLMLY